MLSVAEFIHNPLQFFGFHKMTVARRTHFAFARSDLAAEIVIPEQRRFIVGYVIPV